MTDFEIFVNHVNHKVDSLINRVISWRYGLFWIALIAIILSVLSRTPSGSHLFDFHKHWSSQVLGMQVAHPLTPINPWDFNPYHNNAEVGVTSHLDKLAFRLTIPVIGHFLGTGADSWLLLTILSGVIFYFLFIRLIAKIVDDKLIATYLTFAFAVTWTGSFFFNDNSVGDGVGWLFLLLAFSFESPIIIFVAILGAAFTDERALIASAAIPLFRIVAHVGVEAPIKNIIKSNYVIKVCIATVLAWAAYFTIRMLLKRYYGLTTGDSMMFYPAVFWYHVDKSLPYAWLKVFKALWFLLPVGLLTFVFYRKWLMAAMYIGIFVLVAGISLIVADIERSMAYSFPLLLIALQMKSLSKPNLLWMARTSFIISLILIVPFETVFRYLRFIH